ncbi:helix-turn-helix domain-containing protein [Thermus aquaticus]|uniref:helix-turn-helix domain-containing protein n=1 Tax=Thermus aquaticus TaxID=271 RepID=UPI0006804913
MDAKRIGQVIREARLAKGLSQAKLAKMVGITQPSLSEIERGICAPSAPVMLRLFKALDISEKLIEVLQEARHA